MKKPEIQTTIKEDSGKLLQDIGKLIFGSMFLGGVLRGELPQTILIIAGFTGAVIFCVAGLVLAARKKNRGDIQLTEKQEG
jgi:uncharacterized membrane protein YraQ (UPF0718 family)